jgi:hypothetical protein
MNTFDIVISNTYNLLFNLALRLKFWWYKFFVTNFSSYSNTSDSNLKLRYDTDNITREKIISEWKPHDYWAINGVSFVGMHSDNPILPEDPSIHTQKPIQVKSSSEGNFLYLQNIKEKYEYKSNNNIITFPFQSAKILYPEPFHFGYFEIVCKIPRTHSAWPAFWLSGEKSWPPEIDIFEFWTTDKPDTQVISLHHGNDSKRQDSTVLSKQRHTVNYKLTGKSFNLDEFTKFACHWQPDKIDFYTNDILIYRYQPSSYIMQFFNQPMYLIANNMVYKSGEEDIYEAYYPNSLQVKSIKVYSDE